MTFNNNELLLYICLSSFDTLSDVLSFAFMDVVMLIFTVSCHDIIKTERGVKYKILYNAVSIDKVDLDILTLN